MIRIESCKNYDFKIFMTIDEMNDKHWVKSHLDDDFLKLEISFCVKNGEAFFTQFYKDSEIYGFRDIFQNTVIKFMRGTVEHLVKTKYRGVSAISSLNLL